MVNSLHKRVLDICYRNRSSHIGSSICAVDIIDKIYSIKQKDDIFILSSGHAGLALYVVLEKYYGINAEELYHKHGLHPHMDTSNNIFCSTGSLGMGITIGTGVAVANPKITVYVLISDGECYEGSVWESLSFIDENKLNNIEVYVNINGYAAYKEVNKNRLKEKLISFLPNINIVETNFKDISFLNGLEAHYKVMSDSEYQSI